MAWKKYFTFSKGKVFGEAPQKKNKKKLTFDIGFILTRANIKPSGNEIEKFHRNFFIIIISLTVTCEMMIDILFSMDHVRVNFLQASSRNKKTNNN